MQGGGESPTGKQSTTTERVNVEHFDDQVKGLISELSSLHIALRDAFAELPALPIAIPMMATATLHDATAGMADAVLALRDLPGHPMLTQSLGDAGCQWICGVYATLAYTGTGDIGALVAARFSARVVEQDLSVARMTADGTIPDFLNDPDGQQGPDKG